jgi:hypothetical protein
MRFTPAPGGLGTEVKFAVEYESGKLFNALAKLFRHSPEQQMREDLRHIEQWMEAGELPTTSGQPAGRTEKVQKKTKWQNESALLALERTRAGKLGGRSGAHQST